MVVATERSNLGSCEQHVTTAVHETYSRLMQTERLSKGARISAETSASANLDEVCRWLLECRSNPLRLEAEHLPSLGQRARLMLAVPMTARRAVLCALWLLDDADADGCLLSGQLRFVAHPSGSDITLTFSGRTAMETTTALLYRRAHHVVGQLLQLIAESIQRPPAFTLPRQVAI